MSGHTVQRCYKIHSYPPGHRLYRSKRLAAAAIHGQDEESWLGGLPGTASSDSAPVVSLPTLNADQFQQLLSLLDKQQGENHNSTSGTGFMVGKTFCFLTSIKNNDWIIDSGASDHITPHLNLFSSVQKLNYPGFITMANGKQSSIEHIGIVVLP